MAKTSFGAWLVSKDEPGQETYNRHLAAQDDADLTDRQKWKAISERASVVNGGSVQLSPKSIRQALAQGAEENGMKKGEWATYRLGDGR